MTEFGTEYMPEGIDPRLDLETEFRNALSDIARGLEPHTVTHALIAERERGAAVEDIVAITGQPQRDVELTLAMLEDSGWVIRYPEDGMDMYILNSPGQYAS